MSRPTFAHVRATFAQIGLTLTHTRKAGYHWKDHIGNHHEVWRLRAVIDWHCDYVELLPQRIINLLDSNSGAQVSDVMKLKLEQLLYTLGRPERTTTIERFEALQQLVKRHHFYLTFHRDVSSQAEINRAM